MNKENFESCSIIVTGRDKFSPTFECLGSIIEHTDERHPIVVVLGGAPESIKNDLKQRFSEKVKFIFKEGFMNQPQGRNIGLREVKTRFAIVMDNDVKVRKGWLEALLKCQKETGSVMVVPTVLETHNAIHTAGNRLYVSHEKGKAFAYKILPYHLMVVGEKTNLKREEVDYGELHCQLVEVEPTVRLKAFDEHLQEVGECGSGLTWAQAGLKMYYEPASVVEYMYNHPVQLEDVRFFIWRWDMRAILKGYEYFEKKWNMDITEHGHFGHFLLAYNKKVGFFTRLLVSKFGMRLDSFFLKACKLRDKLLGFFVSPWRRFLAWKLGYYEWVRYMSELEKTKFK